MNTRKIRENTFRVEFTNFPRKPTSEEVHTFVARDFGVSRAQMVKLQLSHTDECAFVKVVDLTTAQSIVQAHDNRHDYEVKGVKYKIRIRMADGGVEVRLHDLSEHVTNEQISRHMAAYGEVLSVQDLLWSEKHHYAGFSSGIRQVKMVLREPIKSYLTIGGESTYVTYPKQRPTCRHCGEFMHTGISCVQNKKLLAQKVSVNERLNRNSYAGAVRGSSAGFNTNGIEVQSDSLLVEDSSPATTTVHTVDGDASTSGTANFPSLATPLQDAVIMDCSVPIDSRADEPLHPQLVEEHLNVSAADETGAGELEKSESLSSMKTDDSADGYVLEKSIVCGQNGEVAVVPSTSRKSSKESGGKHKNDDTNTSNTFIQAKRGRGRPKKM